ncbi:hypothetical protein GCM10010347_17280 [Streptomyces cirratus]|uniref:Lipoprotein n=2 Tax=Streptomyces cirratus TaxID=68187 RepID=A0ABQ3ESG3_9ACTN|nr:hypothetical protein GCM10010347_17280 [Streptomyces cirratus]
MAAALLGAVVLGGCGLARPDHSLVTFSTEASAAGSLPSPGPGAPSPESGAPSPPPAATERLVTVTRSGGFAGRTHTLTVTSDGAWTRQGARAEPEGAGRLSGAQLTRLRTAVQEADFAHPPRPAKSGGTVFDGFTYTFVRGTLRLVTDDGSVPPALTKVLDALPPFEG